MKRRGQPYHKSIEQTCTELTHTHVQSVWIMIWVILSQKMPNLCLNNELKQLHGNKFQHTAFGIEDNLPSQDLIFNGSEIMLFQKDSEHNN